MFVWYQILDAVGPTVLLGSDFQRLRSEGYLSPYHPRYPEKLTNSAHPAVSFIFWVFTKYSSLYSYFRCLTRLSHVTKRF